MDWYPLAFEPQFRELIWGGHALRPFLGADVSDAAVGEAWILTDQGDRPSIVADGPRRGQSLRYLLGPDLLGATHGTLKTFPLLLKWLDAEQPLSVQVHPDDAGARKHFPDALGKTEAWVIRVAREHAKLYAGLTHEATAATLKTAMREGHVDRLLHVLEPCPGDCVFLPAGTVHAIGAGLQLFEIQQTSDITYRLFDWNRIDARTGKPRELHPEAGLASVDFTAGPVAPERPIVENGRELLATCPYFRLWRHTIETPKRIGEQGQCRILVAFAGQGTLRTSAGDYPFPCGSVRLLPAVLGAVEVVPVGPLTVLECGLP